MRLNVRESFSLPQAHLITNPQCALGQALIKLILTEQCDTHIVSLVAHPPRADDISFADSAPIPKLICENDPPHKSNRDMSPNANDWAERHHYISINARDWWKNPLLRNVGTVFLCNPDGYLESSPQEAISEILLRTEDILTGLVKMRRMYSTDNKSIFDGGCAWSRLVVQSTLVADDYARVGMKSLVKICEGSTQPKGDLATWHNRIQGFRTSPTHDTHHSMNPARYIYDQIRRRLSKSDCAGFATNAAWCYNILETWLHHKFRQSPIEVIILRLPLLTHPVFSYGSSRDLMDFNEGAAHPELPQVAKRVQCKMATPQFCPTDYAATVCLCLSDWNGVPIDSTFPFDEHGQDRLRARIHQLTKTGYPILQLDRVLHFASWPTSWISIEGPLMPMDWSANPRRWLEILVNWISWLLLLAASPIISSPLPASRECVVSRQAFREGLTFDGSILSGILSYFEDRLERFSRVDPIAYIRNETVTLQSVDVLSHFQTQSMRKLVTFYRYNLEENQMKLSNAVFDEILSGSSSEEELRDTHRGDTRATKIQAIRWMSSDFASNTYVILGLIANLVLKKLFPKILIDIKSLRRLSLYSSLLENGATSKAVLLVPSHQSYFDFVVLSYTCLSFALRLPMVAADETFANIPLVATALKSAGAFFLRRNRRATQIESDILRVFFKKALHYHRWVQFFIEGGRSRTGYVGRPKKGLLQEGVHSIILPVRICYSVSPELVSMGRELLGCDKEPESFRRFFLSASPSSIQKQGHVQIKVGNPMCPSMDGSHTDVSDLAWRITYCLQDMHLISLSSLLASVMLYDPQHIDWDWEDLEGQFQKSLAYIGSSNMMNCQEATFDVAFNDAFPVSGNTHFKSIWTVMDQQGDWASSVSTVPSAEDVTCRNKAKVLRSRNFETVQEANEAFHLVGGLMRFGVWDMLGVDIMTAVVLLDNFRFEKSNVYIMNRMKVLAEYIKGLVWGTRILQMPASTLSRHVERVRHKAAADHPYTLRWLRSHFAPLANAWKSLASNLMELLDQQPLSPISCSDFAKRCRLGATLCQYQPGSFPLIDTDLLRSVLPFGGYSASQNGGQELPKILPLDQLRSKVLKTALHDFGNRVKLDVSCLVGNERRSSV